MVSRAGHYRDIFGKRVMVTAVRDWLDKAVASDVRVIDSVARLETALQLARLKDRLKQLRALRQLLEKSMESVLTTQAFRGFFSEIRNDINNIEALAVPPAIAALELSFEDLSEELTYANEAISNQTDRSIFGWLRRPIIKRITPVEFVEMWRSLTLNAGDKWIDIGSGNGMTLASIGRESPSTEVIGIDFANSKPLQYEAAHGSPNLSALPKNVTYLAVGRPCQYTTCIAVYSHENIHDLSALMRRKIVGAAGARRARVVSLFYPYYANDEHGRRQHLYQLGTSLILLRSEGFGILITEDHRAFDDAIRFLRSHRWKVEKILYSTVPLSGKQLISIGVQPYIPMKSELNLLTSHKKIADDPFRPFNWGFPLIFTRR